MSPPNSPNLPVRTRDGSCHLDRDLRVNQDSLWPALRITQSPWSPQKDPYEHSCFSVVDLKDAPAFPLVQDSESLLTLVWETPQMDRKRQSPQTHFMQTHLEQLFKTELCWIMVTLSHPDLQPGLRGKTPSQTK